MGYNGDEWLAWGRPRDEKEQEMATQSLEAWATERAEWWQREARASEADGMHRMAENCRQIAEDYREGKILPPTRETSGD